MDRSIWADWGREQEDKAALRNAIETYRKSGYVAAYEWLKRKAVACGMTAGEALVWYDAERKQNEPPCGCDEEGMCLEHAYDNLCGDDGEPLLRADYIRRIEEEDERAEGGY